jgi:hypothetical protein
MKKMILCSLLMIVGCNNEGAIGDTSVAEVQDPLSFTCSYSSLSAAMWMRRCENSEVVCFIVSRSSNGVSMNCFPKHVLKTQ